VIQVTQDHDLWWFNGQSPGGGYNITATLTAQGTSSGTFTWSVTAGSSKVQLVNGSTIASTITVLNNNSIIITSTAPSAAAATVTPDVTIQVAYTGPVGSGTCQTNTVVFAPDHLHNNGATDTADATWGYQSYIHYEIRNQFDVAVPLAVPVNENWISGVVTNYSGMNWPRGPAGGLADTTGANFDDDIGGAAAGYTPAAVGPSNPNAGVAVCHWTGAWRVGSATPGNGVQVGCSIWSGSPTCTWQKYEGYARHD
jgi:hypothetical protein